MIVFFSPVVFAFLAFDICYWGEFFFFFPTKVPKNKQVRVSAYLFYHNPHIFCLLGFMLLSLFYPLGNWGNFSALSSSLNLMLIQIMTDVNIQHTVHISLAWWKCTWKIPSCASENVLERPHPVLLFSDVGWVKIHIVTGGLQPVSKVDRQFGHLCVFFNSAEKKRANAGILKFLFIT